MPLYDATGAVRSYQIRPDEPRIVDGKAVKYESPRATAPVLDIHPARRHLLDDPSVPLFITEGVKKADAATSRGLCCLALAGVYGWRGQNGQGGLTALPDWESIALKGRKVYLVFDSDIMEKRPVHVQDVLADSEYQWTDAARLGSYRSVLSVPLLREGEPMGTIALTRDVVEPFSAQEIA